MKTIAFLGLGTMGLPMAANLLRAGCRARLEPFARAAGNWRRWAQAAASPAERRGRRCAGVHAGRRRGHALCGAGGRRAGRAGPGAVHVNMATVSVALAAELARLHGERGVAYVAAPVLGRVNVAEAGQLNILAAGEARALLAVQPLFDAMGRKTWYFGERPEQANAVKLAVNFMIGSAIGAMSEAVAWCAVTTWTRRPSWRWPRPPHSPRRCTRVMGRPSPKSASSRPASSWRWA